MYANISRDTYYRSVLSALGFNVYGVSKMGKRTFCVINTNTAIADVNEIIKGVAKDDIHAYYEILHCGMFKHARIFDGLVKPYWGNFCAMKCRRMLMLHPERKQALIQRLQFIKYHLAAAGGLYDLGSA